MLDYYEDEDLEGEVVEIEEGIINQRQIDRNSVALVQKQDLIETA